MLYIDRKNPPPSWGEVKKLEREEGIEEGIKKGIEESRREVAKKMLKEELSVEIIAKITELPIEEIQKLL